MGQALGKLSDAALPFKDSLGGAVSKFLLKVMSCDPMTLCCVVLGTAVVAGVIWYFCRPKSTDYVIKAVKDHKDLTTKYPGPHNETIRKLFENKLVFETEVLMEKLKNDREKLNNAPQTLTEEQVDDLCRKNDEFRKEFDSSITKLTHEYGQLNSKFLQDRLSYMSGFEESYERTSKMLQELKTDISKSKATYVPTKKNYHGDHKEFCPNHGYHCSGENCRCSEHGK
jgi:septation ring formation regulator EzrA